MEITTKKEFVEQLVNSPNDLEEFKTNVFQNQTSFKIKILSEPARFSVDTNNTLTVTDNGPANHLVYKGRILDNSMAHQKFLADPCDSSIASNPQLWSALTSLHINVVFTNIGDGENLPVGSVVLAEIEPGSSNNLFDLQTMNLTAVELVKTENNLQDALFDCEDFTQRFEEWQGSVSGLPLDPGEATITDEEPPVILALRAKKFVVYEDGTINTIGIRSTNRVPDQFDDVIHLTWKNQQTEQWNDVSFQITTDPGKEVLNRTAPADYLNPAGTAVMKDGEQYIDAYQLGDHFKKPALVQTGRNPVKFWRQLTPREDGSTSRLQWEDSNVGEFTDYAGLNIHRALDETVRVGLFSAGCQVFKRNNDFEKALGIWSDTGQQYFTYTLLRADDAALANYVSSTQSTSNSSESTFEDSDAAE
jgi:hypothetical protein